MKLKVTLVLSTQANLLVNFSLSHIRGFLPCQWIMLKSSSDLGVALKTLIESDTSELCENLTFLCVKTDSAMKMAVT